MKKHCMKGIILLLFTLIPGTIFAGIQDNVKLVPNWAQAIGYINVDALAEIGMNDSMIQANEEITKYKETFLKMGIDISSDINYVTAAMSLPTNLENLDVDKFVIIVNLNYDLDNLNEVFDHEPDSRAVIVSSFTAAPLYKLTVKRNSYIYLALLPGVVAICSSVDVAGEIVSLNAGRGQNYTQNRALNSLVNSISSNAVAFAVSLMPDTFTTAVREAMDPYLGPSVRGVLPLISNINNSSVVITLERRNTIRFAVNLTTGNRREANSLKNGLNNLWNISARPYLMKNPTLAPLATELQFGVEGSSTTISLSLAKSRLPEIISAIIEGDFEDEGNGQSPRGPY